MAISYPRRQTVIIFIVCILAVGATALYAYNGVSAQQNGAGDGRNILVTATTSAPAEPIAATGDWRTAFLEGSSSDSYVAAKTDAPKAEQLTATDEFGRNILGMYMQLHQAGLDTDPTSVDTAAQQLLINNLSSIKPPKSYADADISIESNATPAQIEAYGVNVVRIVKSYVPDQAHNEAVLAQQALDKGDNSLLAQIDPVIANYQSGLAALLALPVPQPLAQYHLGLLNGMSISLSNARIFRKATADPVMTMNAVALESAGLQSMSDAVDGMQAYFTKAGIPFGQ